MKYLAIPFVLVGFLMLNTFQSCQLAAGTGKAHAMIDSFYHCIDRGEYAHIVDNLVDPAYAGLVGRSLVIDVFQTYCEERDLSNVVADQEMCNSEAAAQLYTSMNDTVIIYLKGILSMVQEAQ